ncbi:MAG: CBS domain-containing protein [Bacilli bacterium]|nr:CBS domain-containing protein [Bacilli bacterium]
MKNNNDIFLSLYNELDSILRNRYQNDDYFSSAIMRFIRELNKTGQRKYIDIAKRLDMIRVLRNDLIHEYDMNAMQLVNVSDETNNFLKQIIYNLNNPKRAIDICTKKESIKYISTKSLKAKVINVISLMREKGFSQLPIIDDNDVLVGVFSPNVLFDYFKNHQTDIANLLLEELIDYLPINKHFSETYIFVRKDMDVYDLYNLLQKSLLNNEKLSMIFVSENGRIDEPILGLLVPKDIIKNI